MKFVKEADGRVIEGAVAVGGVGGEFAGQESRYVGWEAVVNEPPNVVAATPVTDRLPALIFPLTISEVSVPMLVMFGCALVVNVPVSKLPLMVPELANTLPNVPLFVTLNAWADNVPVVLLNVKLALAAKFPASLNNTCVFDRALVVTVPAVVALPAVVAYVAFATACLS